MAEQKDILVEEDTNGGLSLSGLMLPSGMRLKGAENYAQWKSTMLRNLLSADLLQYLRSDSTNTAKVPDDEDTWLYMEEKELGVVRAWMKGNTKACNAISYNCSSEGGASQILSQYSTAADMWAALKKAYEGSGVVIQQQELLKFVSFKYNDQYKDIQSFTTEFKSTVHRLSKVLAKGSAIPQWWPEMLFIEALDKRFPLWSERQRNLLRSKDDKQKPSLEDLIADIQDESRHSQSTGSKSDTTSALHAKTKDERCRHCRMKTPRHSPEDCPEVNTEKRKQWEERTGKQWISAEEYKRSKQAEAEPKAANARVIL